jgi:predicted nucleic acid-binding protein
MVKVFLDASVFFAACYSSTGASREIINYTIRGQVDLIVNSLVIAE